MDSFAQTDSSSDSDSKPVTPVKIITVEDTVAFWDSLPKLPEGAKVSPASDISVLGYVGDKEPQNRGLNEMKNVIGILEELNITCCMVEEAALVYFGTYRVLHQWVICVSTEDVDEVANKIKAHGDKYIPFKPSALTRHDALDQLYPRFKFRGLALFFVILPSQACHIPCAPENIEFSTNGIPYPKLPIYAQSLLDTGNWVDLEDLIDGMNLSLDWGIENLDLEGTPDPEWVRWRAKVLNRSYPEWCDNAGHGIKKRTIWEDFVSPESKKRRQGWKYREDFETRYRKKGHIDPRLRHRDYC